jgi:uncharacterized damage-inducible protein DinB
VKEHLVQFFEYNVWANRLIVKTAERLSEEQFTQDIPYSQNSIRDILVHILLAEWLWRERMQGYPMGAAEARQKLNPTDFPTPEKLLDHWTDEAMKMRNFLGDLTEEGIMGTFKYTNTAGRELEYTIADILNHVVLHGMQHRAEVALMLTDFGFSPGNLDYSLYLIAE